MRALVALILVLNIGFAAWQLTRHDAPPVRRPSADTGVEPLRLLAEMTKPLPDKAPVRPPAPSASPTVPEPALP